MKELKDKIEQYRKANLPDESTFVFTESELRDILKNVAEEQRDISAEEAGNWLTTNTQFLYSTPLITDQLFNKPTEQ